MARIRGKTDKLWKKIMWCQLHSNLPIILMKSSKKSSVVMLSIAVFSATAGTLANHIKLVQLTSHSISHYQLTACTVCGTAEIPSLKLSGTFATNRHRNQSPLRTWSKASATSTMGSNDGSSKEKEKFKQHFVKCKGQYHWSGSFSGRLYINIRSFALIYS